MKIKALLMKSVFFFFASLALGLALEGSPFHISAANAQMDSDYDDEGSMMDDSEEGDHHRRRHRRGARKGGGGFMKCFKKEFDLTDEQREKIKSIMKAGREGSERGKGKKDMKDFREKMRETFKSDASRAEIEKMINEFVQKKNERMKKRFNKFLDIRDVLTADQRKKIGKCGKKIF